MRTAATADQIQCTVEITACVVQNSLWQWHRLCAGTETALEDTN